jgi:hypothetical protein
LKRERQIETNLAAQALELSARGYSQRQILEALLQFDVHAPAAYQAQFHAGLGPMCPYIEHNGVPVAPELAPSLLYALDCPGIARPEVSDETSTSTTTPAADSAAEGSYQLDGSFIVSGEGAEVSATWTGSFDAADGEVAGSGSAAASSEGACRIEDGPEHRYSFTATWDFDIGGTSSEDGLQIILTPKAGTPQITAGADTEEGATCVGFARDFLAGYTENALGVGPPYEIVVPSSGGSTRVGVDPIWIDFAIHRVS